MRTIDHERENRAYVYFGVTLATWPIIFVAGVLQLVGIFSPLFSREGE